MFWIFISLGCIYFNVNAQQLLLPPCDESFNCISSLTQSDCLRNEFLEIDWTKSCCPVCRGGLGFGVSGCNPTNVRRRCAPGLLCRNATCVLDKDLCSYTYHLKHLKNLPSCELDGSFATKQCFGDMVSGRCFCSDEHGNRIFGFDWRNRAANMTCACSRYRDKLEKSEGRLDVTLHCDRNGNYERLQCDSGICWCAEPTTGLLAYNTRAVPAAMWRALPCYQKEMGDKYMRQCESAANAQNIRRTALAKRGTLDVSFNNIQCDYDGSFGRYTIDRGIASCVWRDGKRIGSYQDSAKLVSAMNCYCARDQKIFEEAGLSFTLACTGNGNYDNVQGMNGRIFCVDPNGYPLTDYFDSIFGLDCNQYLYSKVTEPLDDDDDYDD